MEEALFKKVCATILPEGYDWDTDKSVDIGQLVDGMEIIEASGSTKRSTYSDGGSVRKGKLTGVKRLILLAVVPDIKETHRNFSFHF